MTDPAVVLVYFGLAFLALCLFGAAWMSIANRRDRREARDFNRSMRRAV